MARDRDPRQPQLTRPQLDRRAFLGIVAASSAAAACQPSLPAGAPAPVDAPPADVANAMFFAPLRTAVIPDEIEPAMMFRPLPQPGPR